ncbi:MAG TPA: winged helix-turn-helix domain-containing protein [Phycisphaerales bacterium]|nr:winged helix-turn-helix domain-containing protein [Phycisphaerales bacterium]
MAPKPKRQPGATSDGTELDRAVDALAHPTRRAILLVLYARGGAMPAGLIADRFRHAWPTITRHLRILERAGLVTVQEDGRQRLYGLCPGPLRTVRDWLDTVSTPLPQAGAGEPDHWTQLLYGTMRNTVPPPDPG